MKKRIINKICAALLTASIVFLLLVTASAELKASFSLKGPSTVRAGDSVTLEIKADGNGILGIRAEVTYDKNQLSYSSSSGALSKWKVEITEENGKLSIWAEENNDFKSPINSSVTLIKLNFKASDKLKENDKISANLKVNEASSTEDSIENLSSSYSVKVSKPLSDNCDLSSLSIEGCELTPEFSKDVTDYEVKDEIAYTQTALKIAAKAADGEANIDVSGSRLSVGDNTITVKVTAEDGKTTKTYKIKVRMAQDPDYVPSSESSISMITVSEGILSPKFDKNVFDYIVYLPYEVSEINVNAQASDKKASVTSAENISLELGDNIVKLICTAENGDTSEYSVKIVRMEAYTPGITEEMTTSDPETSETTNDITETAEPPVTVAETDVITNTETDMTTDSAEKITEEETAGTDSEPEHTDRKYPLWMIFIALIVGLCLGGVVAVIVMNASNERK